MCVAYVNKVLRAALLRSSRVTRGETYFTDHTVDQAYDTRDAMAKVLYSRVGAIGLTPLA